MELQLFRTFWGVTDPLPVAAEQAAAAGFDGLELPLPQDPDARAEFESLLARTQRPWIAEICTAGGYVPRRDAGFAEHRDDLEQGLRACAPLRPVRVNCMAGLDAWEPDDSLRLFEHGMDVAAQLGLELCFETHRSRSLFNPWVTRKVVEALPGIRLTADVSHWCVVAERLMDTEMDTIEAIAPNVRHIHARVGHDQGPQVPHPAAPEYRYALEVHQQCWEHFWDAQRRAGLEQVTMTPEFGPDGYLPLLPFTRAPVADLWSLNTWIADTERHHFRHWLSEGQGPA
jgi:sugar phosphate isomerase/epimerase